VSLFFLARMLVGFVALATLMLSWRAALVMGACLLMDFFSLMGGVLPGGANVFLLGLAPLGLGVPLGVLISWGSARLSPRDAATLSFAISLFLRLSWIDPEHPTRLLQAWPIVLTVLIAFPLGVLIGSAAITRLQRKKKPR